MSRNLNSLAGRVVKLERLKRPTGSGFFMIWGRDGTELANKLREARERGDLSLGDKFDTRIWILPTPPPSPRWTRLDEVSREELVIIAGGEDLERQYLHSSIACQWSDADLCDFYSDGLPRLA